MKESVYLNNTAITAKTMALCFKKLRDLDKIEFVGSKMRGEYSINKRVDRERWIKNFKRLGDNIRTIKNL